MDFFDSGGIRDYSGLVLVGDPGKNWRHASKFYEYFLDNKWDSEHSTRITAQGKSINNGIGFIGMLAGVLMVTRNLTRHLFSENLIVFLLGTIISLTGILHVGSGFRFGKQAIRGRTTLSVMLGVFKLILGILILISDGGRSPTIYWIAIIWSLLGGALFIGDAFREWGQRKSNE